MKHKSYLKRTIARLLCAALLCVSLSVVSAASAIDDSLQNATFEEVFGKKRSGGASPVKMRLEGDNMIVDYDAVFFIERMYPNGEVLTDERVNEIVEQCVEGFKDWEGIYTVRGRELTVQVNVNAQTTERKSAATVQVLPDTSWLTSIVPGAIFWRPNSAYKTMYLRAYSPMSYFVYTAKHEFGHLLGLFDAYGYGSHTYGWTLFGTDFSWVGDYFLPEAPYDRAPNDAIMRSNYWVYPADMEMVLWAWNHGRLQLYTDSILTWLGAEVSPAFDA